MDEELEQIQFVCRTCYVYKLPPRQSTKGHRAADWGLDKPLWEGRMRVVTKGKNCTISLDDKGQLFAEAPIKGDEVSRVVEPVVDSSRYFVLRVENNGRHAFLGAGFKERAEAFDFNVALQDFTRSLHKEKESLEPYQPKHDFSLKAGEKIKISIKKKKETAEDADGTTTNSGSEVSLGNIGFALAQLSTSPSTTTTASTTATDTTAKKSLNPFASISSSQEPKSSSTTANPFENDPFGDSSDNTTSDSSTNDWVAF
eukprot:m.14877 g.14877  ORF g.14877 m.14877 type:complete len:257 (-) comp7771_c0_seq1:942-1712(-)